MDTFQCVTTRFTRNGQPKRYIHG